MAKYVLEERLSWRWWVTPKPLEDKPIHRWYIFPHSFSGELVHELIEEWDLGPQDHILDPFAGAGTTILAAKESGVPASGYDLSPLAVLVARTKITDYNVSRIKNAWKFLEKTLDPSQWNGVSKPYPKLVRKALPGRLLGGFDTVARQIDRLPCSRAERDFFRLALLATVPVFSHAVATGGWLKWIKRRARINLLPSALAEHVEVMIDDLHKLKLPHSSGWRVGQADARQLPDEAAIYSAVITSPPYPNRHDYTRVFGVELMFGLL